MTPAKRNLVIYAGSSFLETVVWKTGTPPVPVDLADAEARMHVRRQAGDADPLLELTMDNDRIEIPVPAEGAVTMRLSPSETAALDWELGVYALEVELADGTVRRLLEGTIYVSPEVTR